MEIIFNIDSNIKRSHIFSDSALTQENKAKCISKLVTDFHTNFLEKMRLISDYI